MQARLGDDVAHFAALKDDGVLALVDGEQRPRDEQRREDHNGEQWAQSPHGRAPCALIGPPARGYAGSRVSAGLPRRRAPRPDAATPARRRASLRRPAAATSRAAAAAD